VKNRQTDIFKALLVTEKGIALKELLEKLGCGKRTLYYDIENINDWMKRYSLGKVLISGSVIRAEIQNVAALEKQLKQDTAYFLSVSERRAMEIVYIALSDENISISHLMKLCEVSKNTILGDIKEIREMLGSWGLSLDSTIKSGYLIQGEEMTIRKMLGKQFQRLSSPVVQTGVSNFLQRTLVNIYHNEIDFGELCRCLIKQYETDIQGDYILANTGLIKMMIQAALIRSRKGNVIHLSNAEQLALMKSLSFRSVEFSFQKLRVHGVEVSILETYYITTLFLGIQTTDFLSQEQEELFIVGFAEELVLNFERIACLSFPNRERLQKQLSHHIRPMYYRIKYGIPDNNPLLKDIKTMYPFVFDFTRKAMEEIKINLPADEVSEDELAYLCVYFASNLNEKYIEQDNADNRGVLIVGAENMATAILMREQLREMFGFLLNYRVISLSKLREWMFGDYALVVSLVPLKHRYCEEKIVETDPIITEATRCRIIEILRGDKTIARHDEMIQDIIARVTTNVIGEVQTDKLYLDLLCYFEEKGRGKRNLSCNVFYEKIEKGIVLTLPEKADLYKTIMLCSRFLRRGETDRRLAQRMSNLLQNKKLQTYRIQKDVVLIHFPMQSDINPRIDVCLAISPKGVPCPDGSDARIIVGLATKDSYSHWGELEAIYHYFSDQNHADGIVQLCPGGKE
jgi:mannitol operon transcriptional antiterminator